MTCATDIAVIGVGCRFPDAPDCDIFWGNLLSGVVSTREQSEERLRATGLSAVELKDPDFVPVAATVPDVELFAAEFFGYSPAEAELIDPSHRLFLEVCWEALESAGHIPARTGPGPVVGVFASGGPSPYTVALQAARLCEGGLAAAVDDLDLTLGGTADFMASRVAYKLGLRGPSVGIQTACSSSLTGVHYAVLSLLSGECDLAVAGGAAVSDPLVGYRYQPGGVMSQDGQCRPFDARSTGTAAGAGVGAVVLRRLTDALADGDPVLAVIRGSAVGNDGATRPGFTAPSAKGLAAVVAGALAIADTAPHTVRYVEAHGSGTPLGDSIELRGLTEGFRIAAKSAGTPAPDNGGCAVGSVKANIGHAGWAAGIAGFIKAVLAAHHGVIPPHPSFEHPRDPGVLADSPFTIPTEPVALDDRDDWHILVNSMGLGGTNASVILAPAPAATRPATEAADQVRLVVSARTRTELDAMSRALADRLDAGAPATDVAYTLRVGRRSFTERRVITAPPERLAAALRLPRPPYARTVKARTRRVLLVAPNHQDARYAQLLAHLIKVFSGQADAVEVAPAEPRGDAYVLRLSLHATPVDAPLLPLTADGAADPDALDEAVTTAWLHGADVDWDHHLRGSHGRRLALPTYPYERRRHWALDRTDLRAALAPGVQDTQRTLSAQRTTAGTGTVEDAVLDIWAELFGTQAIGPDDEFGALGGTSLLSVKMGLEMHARLGVLVNLHRAGGSRATVRRLAALVRADRTVTEATPGASGASAGEVVADGEGALVDADLALPLGEVSAEPGTGTDVLLTGATGFLGAFLLHQLLTRTGHSVYCLVRADDEADGLRRLREAAGRYALPEPHPDRVRVVIGDLRDVEKVCAGYRDGELADRIGHVLHCAARVVFTEPYSALREDNVLPTLGLLRWARCNAVREFGFVSSLAATGPALGAGNRVLESREQPLDPAQGGYGVSKWVGERLLERAETEGMRVRVFRPGLILGSTATGACNPKDMVWRMLAAGLAAGAHPLDDRPMPMAPVDLVSRAVVDLAFTPGAAGRAFHLVGREGVSAQRLFTLLADRGLVTEPLSREDWLRAVAERARAKDNDVLSSMALYDLTRHESDDAEVEAEGWQPWLAGNGASPLPTGESLRAALAGLASLDPEYRDLFGDRAVRAPRRGE